MTHETKFTVKVPWSTQLSDWNNALFLYAKLMNIKGLTKQSMCILSYLASKCCTVDVLTMYI